MPGEAHTFGLSFLKQNPLYCFKQLPERLPKNEPYYYLSLLQKNICQEIEPLQAYVSLLPCWVPHRVVSNALGYGELGIQNALRRCLDNTPYVWATEFENVHATWCFEEPRITVEGVEYRDSEHYYHQQKPYPFDALLWDSQRDDVMRRAVEAKFSSSLELRQLLLSTHNHPLLSIKRDSYWGVLPDGSGENRLAELLMELRAKWQGALS